MRDPSVIEIDLAAVTHNFRVFRRLVGPDCVVCPVIKADAYGLGAVRVAPALGRAGADQLAVFTGDQAAELLRAGVSGTFLVLMPVRDIGRADDLYRALICGRLHLTVHDAAHLRDLVRLARKYAISIPVHLEVDTGMSRGGCRLGDAGEVLASIAESPRLELAGIFTQFTSARAESELMARQSAAFETFLETHAALIPRSTRIHAANTIATLRDPRFHRSMVRIGQGWIGYGAEDPDLPEPPVELLPAVRFTSRVIHLKTIEAGDTVGYDATWTAKRTSLIGLVPVGYADGYPRALSNPPPVGWSSGRRGRRAAPRVTVRIDTPDGPVRVDAPLVGRVNMDQITIDLTDLGGRRGLSTHVGLGTEVELISPNRDAANHLPTLAALAGTTPYEMLCSLGQRTRRVYHQAVHSSTADDPRGSSSLLPAGLDSSSPPGLRALPVA